MHYRLNQVEQVFVPNLETNDIISHYGATFRIISRHDAVDCVSFKTECLESEGTSIPKHWLNDWTVQGNFHATVRRVTDPAVRARFA